MPITQRAAQLRADAGAQHQRQRAQQGGQRGHQDRTKTQQAELEDVIAATSPIRARRGQKSIIMMAFFTIPISRMMPMMAMTSSSLPASINASSAPRPAVGRVERMVIGWIKHGQHAKHDVHRHDRRHDQPDGVAQRGLKRQGAALELGLNISREAEVFSAA